jgi:YidC/Oxa1 family membrane protein insertase
MEKRALLAVVLSLAFFYGYSLLFPPAEKQAAVKPPQQQAISSAQRVSVPVPVQPLQPVVNTAVAVKDVTVDTDLFTAVFSNQGGTLKRLVLKNYRENSAVDAAKVLLFAETNPEGFSLKTASVGFSLDPLALYSTSDKSLTVSGTERKQLEFVWRSPQGVVVKKVFSFTGSSYAIAMKTTVLNVSAAPLTGTVDLLLSRPAQPPPGLTRFEVNNVVTFADESFSSTEVKDMAEKTKTFDGAVAWSGYADKYFLSAVLAANNSIKSVSVRKVSPSYLESRMATSPHNLLPGQSHTNDYRLFFGPKDLDILKAEGAGLEKSLDLGWFAALATPLLYALKFLHTYTNNYGFAIIIITIIIKLLFFPLTHKSYKSMKDMQKLQPKMAELKEKHKDDRDAMNKAIMELYRTNKVNPLGGCLPMVVQIPVFFALYKALMFSIELRHAPFMLWITDLSAKDPYYVTPIIMGVTMFIQQKMTPTTMDPIQEKVMLALPVVFTFMFLGFPSGLVIYWLVNNILTICQQMYINKSFKHA